MKENQNGHHKNQEIAAAATLTKNEKIQNDLINMYLIKYINIEIKTELQIRGELNYKSRIFAA